MAGVRTAVVVVVAGTKAAADWMEMMMAAASESLERVIFFDAWMKLVSVQIGCDCIDIAIVSRMESRVECRVVCSELWKPGTPQIVE